MPETAREWMDMLSRLAHIQIGPAKESHNYPREKIVRAVARDGSDIPITGPATVPIYYSVEADVAVDALVVGVDHYPPNTPGQDDTLYPHGRLRLTMDLFLNKPITFGHEKSSERIDDA